MYTVLISCDIKTLTWYGYDILVTLPNWLVSLATVFFLRYHATFPQRSFFGGSVAWHPKKRLQRRLRIGRRTLNSAWILNRTSFWYSVVYQALLVSLWLSILSYFVFTTSPKIRTTPLCHRRYRKGSPVGWEASGKLAKQLVIDYHRTVRISTFILVQNKHDLPYAKVIVRCWKQTEWRLHLWYKSRWRYIWRAAKLL